MKMSAEKEKKEIRYTICISDGCLEEIAEYASKERCLEILQDFCEAYAKECYTVEVYDHAADAAKPATCKNNLVYYFPEK